MTDSKSLHPEPEAGGGGFGGLASLVRRAASAVQRARNRLSLRLAPRGPGPEAPLLARTTDGAARMLRTSRRIARWSGLHRPRPARVVRERLRRPVLGRMGGQIQLSTEVLGRHRPKLAPRRHRALPLAPGWFTGLTRSFFGPNATRYTAPPEAGGPARPAVAPRWTPAEREAPRLTPSRPHVSLIGEPHERARPLSRPSDVVADQPDDRGASRMSDSGGTIGRAGSTEMPGRTRRGSELPSSREPVEREPKTEIISPARAGRVRPAADRPVYRAVRGTPELPERNETREGPASTPSAERRSDDQSRSTIRDVGGRAQSPEGRQTVGLDPGQQGALSQSPGKVVRRPSPQREERGRGAHETRVRPLQTTPTAAADRGRETSDRPTPGFRSVRSQMVKPKVGATAPWRWSVGVLRRVRSAVLRSPVPFGHQAVDAEPGERPGTDGPHALGERGEFAVRGTVQRELAGPSVLRARRESPFASQAARAAEDRRERRRGRPLRPAQRAAMEESLDADFGDVRLHTDAEAADAAAELKADAFAIDQDVYFATGRASFSRSESAALLAHELTHVRQARKSTSGSESGGALSEIAAEREAHGNEEALRLSVESGESSLRAARGPAMDLPNLRIQLEGSVDAGQPAATVTPAVTPFRSALQVARAPVRRAAAQGTTTEGVGPAAETGADTGENENELDVAAVASQVYEMIMRRLTLERERIGFH